VYTLQRDHDYAIGDHVFAFVGTAWQQVALQDSVKTPHIVRLFRGGDGYAYALYELSSRSIGVARVAAAGGQAPSSIAGTNIDQLSASVDAAGKLTILDLDAGAIRQGPASRPLPQPALRPEYRYEIDHFAFDAAGRFWLELDTGLAVIEHDRTT